MAINVSGEQSVKQTLRANINGGANVWWSNPIYGTAAIALDGTLGVKAFKFVGISGGTYVVSGINGTATVTGTLSSTTNVGTVVGLLTSGSAAGVFYYTPNKTSDLVVGTNFDVFITATGTVPTPVLTTGSGTIATVTQVTGNLSNLAAAFPNFYGTPFAAPTWVDDATVHNNRVTFSGTGVAPLNVTEQTQVRQIQTNYAETQLYAGYYIAYSGNLVQTQQKNTKNQQC
jgi:hypothetical protein